MNLATQPRTKIDVTPEITRQLATRRALGISLRDLESEFGFSRPVVNRVLSSELAKAVIKGITEDAVSSAVIAVRKGMSDMTEEITRVLTKHLKEDSLEAVKIVLRGLGMENMEKAKDPTTQSITVILPGQQAPKEVKNGDIEV